MWLQATVDNMAHGKVGYALPDYTLHVLLSGKKFFRRAAVLQHDVYPALQH
uniref:Uncharacterized protein n=1 Tax=Rheinheimera sp. BAL341 TaxID=1708203 RepID=A0A486XTX7_9GAMM